MNRSYKRPSSNNFHFCQGDSPIFVGRKLGQSPTCSWTAAKLARMPLYAGLLVGVLTAPAIAAESGARPVRRYFAHPVVEDRYGVIAPWYKGQNGQCDFRLRVAAETLKRYPWAQPPLAVMAAPHFVFNGHWSIKPDGTIVIDPRQKPWDNGDVGQRSASVLTGMVNYYRYSGDPAALGIINLIAEYVLGYCQTPADHPWPGFFISCPTKGRSYGQADSHGFIQLDVAAWVGSGLVSAYQLTGNQRYLEAVNRWADLLAEHCDLRPTAPPWNRYANPKDVGWGTQMTGGVALVLQFLDDVIGLGHRGRGEALVKARAAGERYLRETLLPQWSQDPTWGHHFWDWENQTNCCTVPNMAAQYMMHRQTVFPQWGTDVRNVLSLFFARAGVDPNSAGGLYSGAWAFPESSSCCGKSLQYPILPFAATLARYAAMTGNSWAREIARRQSLLFTYDCHETGVVEDGIDGGQVVTGEWFNLAHPWPLRGVMDLIAWQPETMGANRENHIMRSTSVVRNVYYGKGLINYQTFDAPAGAEDVLRLAFSPKSVTADGSSLPQRPTLSENGYTLKPLSNGDCILTIRHDGCRNISVGGDDPQEVAEADQLRYDGPWSSQESPAAAGIRMRVAEVVGASASFEFTGNQVRLVGRADPNGGRADVYLDGVKQLCGIDCWCPQPRDRQVICYKNGLSQGKHSLKIVTLGRNNPRASGTRIYVQGVQWSAAQGEIGTGVGGGPSEPQRVIFGYTGRHDYRDSQGYRWRPATEFVLRLKTGADLVPIALYTAPRLKEVTNTADPELYRYGVHGADFTAYFTVDPKATYYARIKLCQSARPSSPGQFATTIDVQGKRVAADVDIAATAGGLARAVDLVFNDLRPAHGLIALRFSNHRSKGEAMVQALEIGPGHESGGTAPVSVPSSSGGAGKKP